MNRDFIHDAVTRFRIMLEDEPKCGSPIEAAVANVFRASTALHQYGWYKIYFLFHNRNNVTVLDAELNAKNEQLTVHVFPQSLVNRYRVDFLCSCYTGVKVIYLAVECDGHDFHDRTKEQAAHDRRRDRELLMDGIPTMRFTGSEIHADAIACVGRVSDFFSKEIGDNQ